ncbi:MAG: aldo/keto reductase family protein [Planctomycetota bacterium]
MRYRNLGRSGLKVSVVSLGSWLTFGGTIADDLTAQCVKAAIDGGVNLIDTADIYAKGGAEEALGRVLPDYKRSDYVLATKCYWPMTDNVNDRGLSRKHIIESCHKSLQRLHTDYLDLYQCHRPDPTTPIEETVRAMHTLIEQGKILYWGVSCWTAAQIVEACWMAERNGLHKPISNQPHYSMLFRGIEAETLAVCKQHGLGQIVWSPLEQGVLTGKYDGGTVPADSRGAHERYSQFVKKWLTDDTLGKVEKLKPIAEKLKISRAHLALAWALRDEGVASTIMGATKVTHVTENIAAGDVELSADVIAEIEAVLGNAPPQVEGY